ncbi:MAG: hypothetical protein APR63_11010 [Desulfuromonas sp. SDB]|nr:MAG: hypothetical protein APR63_11010 [Desulfuromonas sp. SDB]
MILTASSGYADMQWTGNGTCITANIVSYNLEGDPLDYLPGNAVSENSASNIQQLQAELGTVTTPSHYAPCWADDRLVSNDWNLTTRSKLAFDYDSDDNLYAAAISTWSNQDTIKIFKSTDRGYTWNEIWWLSVQNQSVEFWDIAMRVVHSGSDPDIYLALIDSNYTDGQLELRVFCYNQTTHNFGQYFFDPDTYVGFENPIELAMDITNDAIPQIWVTYNRLTSTSGWSSVYSTNGGVDWSYQGHSGVQGGGGCDVCMGPDDYVYLVNIYTESSNRVRMYRTQFSSSGDYFNVSPTTAEERSYPSVASTTHSAYGYNVVHVLYQRGTGSASRIRNSYSSDGGDNWTIDEMWSPTGDAYTVRPFIRNGWDGDEFVGLATNLATDSLVVGTTYWMNNTVWQNVYYPASHRPTGEITPQGFRMFSRGTQIIYRQFGSDYLWYDRGNMANSVEEITPGSSQIMNITQNGHQVDIQFSLDQSQPVNINLFDVSGRNVRNLCNQTFLPGEHSLSYDLMGLNGSYIVHFQAGSQTNSEKIFIF